MKSNFPLILAWIWILTATAVGGECGWRKVERKKMINFNWDSHILEVKTEDISSDSIEDIEDKQLKIMLDTEKQTGEIALKIWNFILTRSNYNGVEAETLKFDIMLHKENKHSWTQKPPGELQWIFKKSTFLHQNMIQVELAGAKTLEERFRFTEMDKTGMFRFGSGDNISLLYRVNSTDGDGDCVEPGNITSSNSTIFEQYLFLTFP